MKIFRFLQAVFRAAVGFLTSGRLCVDPRVRAARLEVCRACPYSVEHFNSPEWIQCSVCGCLAVPKASLLTEKCPKGLWAR